MSVMMTEQSEQDTSGASDADGRPFEDTAFGFADNCTDLCAEFDRIWQTPLELERELRVNGYERVASRCLDDDCPGYLWVDSAGITCDNCGLYVRKDESFGADADRFDREDPWQTFFENRPAYRSGRRKCVGGLAHYEWASNHELASDQRVQTMDATEFYR